ncbi:Fluoroacetyl-CoA thioesterase [compost metagenome]
MVELDHLVGALGHAPSVVNADNTAVAMGSGALPVLATPAIVGLVEQAAANAVSPYLPPGMTTVGTGISLRHLAATPIGHNVQAEAVLVKVSGRRLEFKVAAYDEREKIAEGTHERFIVEAERFMAKMSAKRPKGY